MTSLSVPRTQESPGLYHRSAVDTDLLVICGLFPALVAFYLHLGQFLPFPGHGDPCYYLDLARNLYLRRGFVIDYLAYFHLGLPPLLHPAGDYWMPLASIVYWAAFQLFGPTFRAAQVMSAVLGAGLVVLVYRLGRQLLGLPMVWALWAALFLAIDLDWIHTVIVPQSGIVFALVLVPFFLLFDEAARRPAWLVYFLQGLLLGSAHLCRPDGILLWGAFVLMLLIDFRGGRSWRITAVALPVGLAGYLLIMGPWLVRNVMVFGRPLPVPSATFPLMTDYEQIFALSPDLSLRSFLAWGLGPIIGSKLAESWRNVQEIFHFRWIFLLGFAGFAHLKKLRPFQAALAYLGILWFVMSWIITLPGNHGSHGSFEHALPGVLPLLALAFGAGVYALRDMTLHLPGRPLVRSAAFVLLHVVIGLNFCYALFAVHELYGYNDAVVVRETRLLYERLQAIGERLPVDAVVMTRNPWEVYYLTRRPAVQIPSDGLDSFLTVARTYGVTHVLLSDQTRPYLEEFITSPAGQEMLKLQLSAPFEGHIFHYSGIRLYALAANNVEILP